MKEATTFRLPLITIENIKELAQGFNITKSEVIEYAIANTMFELKYGTSQATTEEINRQIQKYFERKITK